MVVCKCCGKPENLQYSPGLHCHICCQFVHLDCLVEKKTPGGLIGDVFFIFTCAECSGSSQENFDRNKMSWFHGALIVMHNLSVKHSGTSNQGFYHWRTHIGSYISKHWDAIFSPKFKRKKNWLGTLAGVLSVYSHLFFQSGSQVLQDSGWWKLTHPFSPALVRYLNTEVQAARQKKGNKVGLSTAAQRDMEYLTMKQVLHTLGFSHLLAKGVGQVKVVVSRADDVTDNVSSKKQKMWNASMELTHFSDGLESRSDMDFLNFPGDFGNILDSEESMSDFVPDLEYFSENSNGILIQSDPGSILNDYQENYHSSEDNSNVPQSLSSHQHKRNIYSEDSSDSNIGLNTNFSLSGTTTIARKNSLHSVEPRLKGLLSESERSEPLPWECDEVKDFESDGVQPASEFEELQVLNQLNNACSKDGHVNVDKKMIRLRSKLALRRLKKSKGLPRWNVDRLVCRLSDLPIPIDVPAYHQLDFRVLDRFQCVTDSLSGSTISSHLDFATRLAGCSEVTEFMSAYSGRLLKPYIRRDTEITSLWLQLMSELENKVNANDPDYVRRERASLDYCYVRPQHIASINSLCAQFFWPGIDLTEALQYPDFSCVVLYKKLVVAFAFLVPDVGTNEAYISYIFTRPDWRRSGIANFMLYHLIQTCIGKDILLHVSATNPAIFLYQKFGFKIEELIQDFYHKYFPANSTECKHALLLRLCR